MPLNYNNWLVLLSVGVAVLVSYAALGLGARISAAKGTASRVWLLLGALSMGIGMWSMHFIGMLALQMPIQLTYSVPTTLASLGVAVVTSGFALHIASAPRLGARHLVCSIVMGCGIAAMHYTGMAAIMIAPGIRYALLPVVASLLIAVFASWVALWLTLILRSDAGRHVRIARLGAATLMGGAIFGMHYAAMAAVLIAPGAICVGGVSLHHGWFATCLAVAALGILGITILSTLFDAHLATRQRIYAASIERADRALYHQATHDSLTGLPNRERFLQSLREAVERVRGGAQPALGVLFLDLDRFKFVNDTQGHEAGDELLRQVAARLASEISAAEVDEQGQPGDIVSRFGGDEFLVLLNRLPRADEAKAIAERLQKVLAATYQIQGREVHCTASIGLVIDRLGVVSADDIVRNADVAMYEAKRGGRAGTVQFNAAMHERISRQVTIESSLRHAIEGDQLQVVYQPIVSLATGRLTSVEALLRWNHPVLGAVPPSEFVPIAEDSGLIVALDRWVREQACRAMKHWHTVDPRHAPDTVSVNVSRVELAQADEFRMQISDLLRTVRLPAAPR